MNVPNFTSIKYLLIFSYYVTSNLSNTFYMNKVVEFSFLLNTCHVAISQKLGILIRRA